MAERRETSSCSEVVEYSRVGETCSKMFEQALKVNYCISTVVMDFDLLKKRGPRVKDGREGGIEGLPNLKSAKKFPNCRRKNQTEPRKSISGHFRS